MKIAIIGLGYWGKIVVKNLLELNYKEILICEEKPVNLSVFGNKLKVIKNYKEIQADKVFVLTPAITHYQICDFFLKKGIDVFCEKPLDTNPQKIIDLYKTAKKYNSYLFVDWIFHFNPATIKIKEIIEKIGAPKNIICNRLNYGPIREDVNARTDLAVHDISIIHYWLNENPTSIQWLDFKRNKQSKQYDSTVGILTFQNTNVQINASWSCYTKNRLYTLEFENDLITWDDDKKHLYHNSKKIEFSNSSPLQNSIKEFFNKKIDQKNITLNITKTLQNES
jgi:predicted dehydrogenase